MRIPEDGGKPEFTGLEHSTFIVSFDLNKDGSRLAFSSDEFSGWEVFSLDNVMASLKSSK